jgi:hypothetical protein
MAKTHRWQDIKKRNRTPKQLEKLELEIQQEIDSMTFKELEVSV